MIWQDLRSDKPHPDDPPREPFIPKSDKVRLILFLTSRWPVSLTAGHYDDLVIEQDLDSGPVVPLAPKPKPVSEPGSKPQAAVPADAGAVSPVATPVPSGLVASARQQLEEVAIELRKQSRVLLEKADDKELEDIAFAVRKQASVILEIVDSA